MNNSVLYYELITVRIKVRSLSKTSNRNFSLSRIALIFNSNCRIFIPHIYYYHQKLFKNYMFLSHICVYDSFLSIILTPNIHYLLILFCDYNNTLLHFHVYGPDLYVFTCFDCYYIEIWFNIFYIFI